MNAKPISEGQRLAFMSNLRCIVDNRVLWIVKRHTRRVRKLSLLGGSYES